MIQINENQKLIGKYWGGRGQNGCGHSSLRTLKLIVSQKGINTINWFLVVFEDYGHFKTERAFMILNFSEAKFFYQKHVLRFLYCFEKRHCF